MADSFAPTFLTVDPQGHIGAQFTGKLIAKGIEFEAPAGEVPEAEVAWNLGGSFEIVIDGAVNPGALGTHSADLAIWANRQGKQDKGSISLSTFALGKAELANLSLVSQEGFAEVTAQAGEVTVLVINSAGESDFARRSAGFEPGDIKATARAAAPAGWLLCDGAAVSRTTYAALFAAIGITYGAGDGSTTFNVPDLRARAPLGLGTVAGVNARGNNEGLEVGARAGTHTHGAGTYKAASHSHGAGTYAAASHSHGAGTYAAASHTHGVGTLETGESTVNDEVFCGQGAVLLHPARNTHKHVLSGATAAAAPAVAGSSAAAAPAVAGSSGTAAPAVEGASGAAGSPYLIVNYLIKT